MASKDTNYQVTEQDLHDKLWANCNKFLGQHGFDWNTLADTTSVWDWVHLDIDPDDVELIKEIVWDKLDLQGSLTRYNVDLIVYGKDIADENAM